MQNQQNETPKIIGLAVAIIAVMAFVIWQFMRGSQPVPVAGTGSTAAGEMGGARRAVGSDTNNITLAGGPNINAKAGAGQMRYFSDTLDSESSPNIGSGRADAFHQFNPPPTQVAGPVHPPVKWTDIPSLGNPRFTGPGVALAQPGPQNTNVTPPLTVEPQMDIKLDGVVLGTPREAVLTIIDKSSNGKTVNDKTLYLHVGDKLPLGGHKVVSITEAGLLMQGWSEVWMVGQTRTIGGPKRADVTTLAPGDNKTAQLPAGPVVPTPPTTLKP